MIEYHNSRPARIVGPNNQVLTRDNLPPAETTRWVAHRKAQVVAAVESGLISLDEVIERYGLSVEEFAGWQRAMDRAGVAGLRIAWLQKDRASHRRSKSKVKGTKLQLVTH
ncbi:DUF1153 domain-containing protein [Novosphingobium sp. MW5]|nr:DUF1153 domain-containing protein [Novosphingobium sp. MW5]